MSFFESYQQTAFFEFPALEFPSVTEAADVYVPNYLSTRNYTFSVTVTNIDESVVVRLDASLDGENYGALISNTITECGTYIYHAIGAPSAFVRGNFFAETGGTHAVVKFAIAAN